MTDPPTASRPRANLRSFLVRGSSWAAAGRLATVLAAFVIHAIVARLLPPAQVGQFLLISSVVLVARTAGQLGLGRTLVRKLGGLDGDASTISSNAATAARPIITTALALAGMGGLVVALALATAPGAWLLALSGGETTPGIRWLAALWTLTLVFEGMVAEAFRGLCRVPHAVCFNGLLSGGLLALLLIVWQQTMSSTSQAPTLGTVVALAVGAALAACLVGMAILARQLGHSSTAGDSAGYRPAGYGPAGDGPSWAALLGPSLPILASTMIALLLEALGLWLLGAMTHDPTRLALYGTAQRLVRLVGMPLLMVNAVLLPVVARLHAQGDRHTMTAALRLAASVTTAIALVASAVLLIAGRPLAGSLFGGFYEQTAPILSILVVGQLVSVWTGSCGILLLMTGHQRTHLLINLMTLALLLTAGSVLARTHGALGVAAAAAATTMVQQLSLMLAARRHTGVWTAGTLNVARARTDWQRLAKV